NRIHALLPSLLKLVDLDKPSTDFDLRAFESEPFRVRHSPNGDQQHLSFKTHRVAFRRLTRHTHSRLSFLQFLELRIDLRLDATFAKTAFELFRHFFIFKRHESRQKFDYRS